MNPKEFDWAADQQVTVTNPTSKPHSFQVHSKFYEVGAKETVRMPGFMAWQFVYTLSLELAQRAGEYDNKWNDETIRAKYYSEVIVGADDLIQTIEPVDDSGRIEKVDTEEAKDEREEKDEKEDRDTKPKTAVHGKKKSSSKA